MGSPCLHPLPTIILGVGKLFIRIEDCNFLKGVYPAYVSRAEVEELQGIFNEFKRNIFKGFMKSN